MSTKYSNIPKEAPKLYKPIFTISQGYSNSSQKRPDQVIHTTTTAVPCNGVYGGSPTNSTKSMASNKQEYKQYAEYGNQNPHGPTEFDDFSMHSSCYPQEEEMEFADKSESSQSIFMRDHNMKRIQFKKAVRPNSVANPGNPPITTPKRQEINPDVILFDSNEKDKENKDDGELKVGASVEGFQKAGDSSAKQIRAILGNSNQKITVKANGPIKSFNEIVNVEVKSKFEELRKEMKESFKMLALDADEKKGKLNQDLENVKHILQSYERNVQGIMREIFELSKKIKEVSKSSPSTSPENRAQFKAYDDRFLNIETAQKDLENLLSSLQKEYLTQFGIFSRNVNGDMEKISKNFEKQWEDKMENIFEQLELKISALEENSSKQNEFKSHLEAMKEEILAGLEKRLRKQDDRMYDIETRQENESKVFTESLTQITTDMDRLSETFESGKQRIANAQIASDSKFSTFSEKLEGDLKLIERRIGQSLEENRKQTSDSINIANGKVQIIEREMLHCTQGQERLQKTLLETQYLIKEIKAEQNAKLVDLHDKLCKTDALLAFTSNSSETMFKEKIKALEDMIYTLNETITTIQRGFEEQVRHPFTDRLELSKSVHEDQYVYNFSNQGIKSPQFEIKKDEPLTNSGGVFTPERIMKKLSERGLEKQQSANFFEPNKGQHEIVESFSGNKFDPNKFDDYLKKYEQFNSEVNSYLQNKKLSPNAAKSSRPPLTPNDKVSAPDSAGGNTQRSVDSGRNMQGTNSSPSPLQKGRARVFNPESKMIEREPEPNSNFSRQDSRSKSPLYRCSTPPDNLEAPGNNNLGLLAESNISMASDDMQEKTPFTEDNRGDLKKFSNQNKISLNTKPRDSRGSIDYDSHNNKSHSEEKSPLSGKGSFIQTAGFGNNNSVQSQRRKGIFEDPPKKTPSTITSFMTPREEELVDYQNVITSPCSNLIISDHVSLKFDNNSKKVAPQKIKDNLEMIVERTVPWKEKTSSGVITNSSIFYDADTSKVENRRNIFMDQSDHLPILPVNAMGRDHLKDSFSQQIAEIADESFTKSEHIGRPLVNFERENGTFGGEQFNNKKKLGKDLTISEISNNNNEENEEIVYQLDENGYLMDDNGNYILDDNGNVIQLSSEHIEYLKSTDMLEEQIIN